MVSRYVIFFLFLSGTIIITSCEQDASSYARENIVGHWKLDSVNVFVVDSLVSTNDVSFYLEYTSNESRACIYGEWTIWPYEIDDFIADDPGFTVITDEDSIRSVIRFQDTNHFKLIKEGIFEKDPCDRHWCYTRTTASAVEKACVALIQQ
ncbi:MAG: hypothetical protein ACI837_002219 [Crocinitomicaceae bacterium]|jgi:hypothetical protein